ncbi:MAG: hypothetical protein RIQ94_2617 [Pseudomonadota bacterium]
MDAGIQSQGCETVYFTLIIYNLAVTIRGTGFWHPCQNDVFYIYEFISINGYHVVPIQR